MKYILQNFGKPFVIVIAGLFGITQMSLAQIYYTTQSANVNITSGAYLNIKGNFQNNSGGVYDNEGTIQLTGNWENNDAAGVFSSNEGTVEFEGGVQAIGGSETTLFNNLTIEGTGNKNMTLNTTVGGGYSSPSPSGVLTLNSNSADLVMNSYELDITNSSASAVDATGGGNIQSETAPATTNQGTPGPGYSYINWQVKTSTGTYTVPFGTSGGSDITFTYTKTTAGTENSSGSGVMRFATYPTGVDNEPWPTWVTHMTNDAGVDNTEDVVNRYWIISETGYSDNPHSEYMFKWDDPTDLQKTSGTIGEASLRPQRYNWDDGTWGDWLWGPDNINTANNTLDITIENEPDYYDIWTLVDESNPLPIELVRFTGQCNDGVVTLNWTTASETNNDFYTVQRSTDGQNFEDVTTLDGAGNSNTLISYTATDYNPYGGTSYYRLKQTDFDGSSEYSDIVAVSCSESSTVFDLITAYDEGNGQMAVVFTAPENEKYTITLFDARGRQLTSETGQVYSAGENKVRVDVGDISRGIYLVTLRNEFKSFGRSVMLH